MSQVEGELGQEGGTQTHGYSPSNSSMISQVAWNDVEKCDDIDLIASYFESPLLTLT